MPQIHISVCDKIARCDRQEGLLVCGNSDYEIIFQFDKEWAEHEEKTARFIWNNAYYDVTFTGERCPVPVITSASRVEVGVYAGTLRTSTPALIRCRRSIRSNTTLRASDEAIAAYHDQAQQAAAQAKVSAEQAEQAASYVEQNLQSVEQALVELQNSAQTTGVLAQAAHDHTQTVTEHAASTRTVYSFTVGQEDEAAYLSADSDGVYDALAQMRYNDSQTQTIYCYPLTDPSRITSLCWHAHLSQQVLLQASLDGEVWTTLRDSGGVSEDSQDYYELAALLSVATSASETLYIRIADSNSEDASGGAILTDVPVTLQITHGQTLPYALPSVTEADNGSYLRVINGRWTPIKPHTPPLRTYTYSFKTGTTEETDLITPDSCGSTNSSSRFNDGLKYTTYRFPIANAALVRRVCFTATMGYQLRVDCSCDGKEWSNVFDAGTQRLSLTRRTYDLTEHVDLLSFDEIYVRISDSNPADSFGGAIRLNTSMELLVERCEAASSF